MSAQNEKKLDKQNIEDIVSLSPVQAGMLFHYLNEPDSGLYFEQMGFRLRGLIDYYLVVKAWEFVIESNEVLRSVYRWDKIEKPVQIVLKSKNVPIKHYDLSSCENGERSSKIQFIKDNDKKEGIDISSEPFRILFIKLPDSECEMVISSYHILFDGWSVGIILKEFLQAYNCLFSKREYEKPKKKKYKGYLKWLSEQDTKESIEYWKAHFKGISNKTILPYDYEKGSKNVDTYCFYSKLPDNISDNLKRFTRENSITTAVVFYSAWGLLLQKYNDSNDVVFGTTVSGRTPEVSGIEDIVGLFINTPPLRVQSGTSDTVLDFIKKTDSVLLERSKHEVTPLTDIKSGINWDNTGNMFESIVVVENYPLDKFTNNGVRKLDIESTSIFEMTNYDLTVVVALGESISFRFIYDRGLVKTDTIRKLSEQLERVIKLITDSPHIPLNKFDILSEEDKELLMFKFNDTKTLLENDRTIHSFFEEQVRKTPYRIAVSFEDNQITYKELNIKANKLARVLRNNGVTTECVVGVIMDRKIDMIVSLLAIIKAGGAYLPIDKDTPVERILLMLKDSNVKTIITDSNSINNISFTSLQNFESNNGVKIVLTEPRGHIKEFNELPIPDRALIDISKYKNKIGMASVNNCITLQTTRGCPYKCLYCHKIWSKHHVYRTAENIFSEIKYYYKNGVRNFAVIDDCFNLNVHNSSKLFELILKNNLKLKLFFPNGLRGDTLTEGYIDLMVEAGTKGINLSLETASQRLQKLLMKNLDLERFKEVIKYIVTKHPDIILELATMHGFPTETEEEAMMTLNFIKDIKWIHFPYIHILKIFPNTEMERFALDHGVSKESILKSKDLAFHELPDTLPFTTSFTHKYQASFLNEYFLSKERLASVLPVQMKILNEGALVQKYNAYLPVEINTISDILKLAKIDDAGLTNISAEEELPECSFFNKQPVYIQNPAAKKVLFLDLSQHFSSHSMLYKVAEQPLGQIYLLTYLKHKLGDKIDGRIYKSGIDFDNYDELRKLIEEYKPDIIGIRTLTYFKDFFHQSVSVIRQWVGDIPIIAGGPYASSDYDTILKDKNVNLVILGEGEHTLYELICCMFESGFKIPDNDKLRGIKGISFVENYSDETVDSSRDILLLDTIEAHVNREESSDLDIAINSHDLAYVMYTSGSTGIPKGVMVEHKQVNNCILWMQQYFGLNENHVILQRTNLTFDPSVWEIFWPLYIGAKVKLIRANQARDAEFLVKLISENNELTMMYCPASLLTGMNYFLENKKDKPSLKMPWLIIGAEAVSPDIVRNFYKYFQGTIVNTYGPTECTINNTFFVLVKDFNLPIVPIGKPVANNSIYILSKDLTLVPLKSKGEIYIGGDSVARGYINNTGRTKESFIKNPFGEGILYKTGDIGRWTEDGNIEIFGRADEQVKVRGYRIELGEIDTILKRHLSIKDCITIVRDSRSDRGENRKCKKCGITTSYPNVKINEDSVCSICSNMETYVEYSHKYFRTLDDLDALIKQKNKNNKSKYDCILLYNGGRGAAYALYTLVERGYKLLTVTYDNGYFTKSDLNGIKMITENLGVDNVVLTHPNTDKMLVESLNTTNTLCRGCFHISSAVACEYAYKNGIEVVIGATLSRGQIIENKLSMFYSQGISDIEVIEKELSNIQRNNKEIDRNIFQYMDVDIIDDGSVYDSISTIDFFRYSDVNNEKIITYLNDKDEYWKSRKNYAIYSTNCPIKQISDYYFLIKKGYHYYGSATSWEKRYNKLSLENVYRDLSCNVSREAVENFFKCIGFHGSLQGEEIDKRYICSYFMSENEVSPSEIREYLTNYIPSYMIPSYFVKIDKIPLTINGKIDKKALPCPDETKDSLACEYICPSNETEENLVEIWRKVLQVDRVGVNDNFFDLGGNSILLIQMHALIEKQFPGKVTITDLFAFTSISKIAGIIQDSSKPITKEIRINSIQLPEEYFFHGSMPNKTKTLKMKFGNILLGIKSLSQKESIDIDDILLCTFAFLISKINHQKSISLETFIEAGKVLSFNLNLDGIDNFISLFKASKLKRTNRKDGLVYDIKDISDSNKVAERNSIVALFYNRDMQGASISLPDIYDVIFEIDQQEHSLDITCEYNVRKLNHERMKELIYDFNELIKAIINGYLAEA